VRALAAAVVGGHLEILHTMRHINHDLLTYGNRNRRPLPRRPYTEAAYRRLQSGPALGMFEVFSRTGPQNLGGPQFWTLQKLNCQLWPVYSLILFANSLKLVPPDVIF